MAKMNIGGLIACFLIMIVGFALTPTVVQMTGTVTQVGGDNLTGASLELMKLVPLFWVILLICIPVAYIALWLKAGG